jgi:hypothetical protein
MRHAGSNLTEGEKHAADAIARGDVPLRVDEAVGAVAPTKVGAIDQEASRIATLPRAQVESANLEAARLPKITEAVEKVTSKFGPGVSSGSDAATAAQAAVKKAEDLVQESAALSFKKAEPKFAKGPTRDAAYRQAEQQVMDDPILMDAIGGAPRNSVKFVDAVTKKMQANADLAAGKGDAWKSDIIGTSKKNTVEDLERQFPDYAEGRQTYQAGREQLVDPLKAGPLGTVSKSTNPTTQSNALFNQTTDEGAQAAIDAAKRLAIENPEVPSGLLSTKVQTAAAKKEPTAFGRDVFPTPQSRQVAEAVNPGAMNDVNVTLDALQAIKPPPAAPGVQPSGGPVADVTRAAISAGRDPLNTSAQVLHDPNIIKELGQLRGSALIARLAALGLAPMAGNAMR